MPSDKKVFKHRRLFKKLDVLKRPCDAKIGHARRFLLEKIMPVKADTARHRRIKPRDEVKDGGFPRTVRPDNGEDFALLDRKA